MMLALMSFQNSRSLIIWINSINDNPWCHHSVFFLSVCLYILSQTFPVVTFFIGSLLMVWSKKLCADPFLHTVPCRLLSLERGRSTLQTNPHGDGSSVPGWKRSLYISLIQTAVQFFYMAQSTLVPKECDCFFLMIIVSLASSYVYQQIHNTSWLPVMFVTFCCKLTLIFLANEQKW